MERKIDYRTPPIGLCSNDVILRMADCDVTSAPVRMTVSRDTNRSISGRLEAPLVAARCIEQSQPIMKYEYALRTVSQKRGILFRL